MKTMFWRSVKFPKCKNVDEIRQNEKPTQSSSMFGIIIEMSLHACLDHIHKHSWHLPQARFPLPHA
jgi:hypothetical protein